MGRDLFAGLVNIGLVDARVTIRWRTDNGKVAANSKESGKSGGCILGTTEAGTAFAA
jgi:hypothetical protein